MITGITTHSQPSTGKTFDILIERERLVKAFDNFIFTYYQALRKDAKTICKAEDDFEDILHNNLIKIRQRIIDNGFTPNKYQSLTQSFHSYIYQGVKNDYLWKKIKEQRKGSQKRLLESIDEIFENDILLQSDNDQDYHDKNDYMVKKIFEYIEIKYSQKNTILFKTYFLTEKNTYSKLVNSTGLKKNTIQKIISEIKMDIRKNLPNYIRNTSKVN